MSRRIRNLQPELSDDDIPSSDPGYHNPSSPKSKACQWTEISTQTPTWGIPSAGFWNDQRTWTLLGIFIFQMVTGMIMVYYFKNSLENNIANLKSCQKREANTDGSLSCSDCMCIATDGFSSKEFSDIVNTQRSQEEKYEKLESQFSEYEEKLTKLKNQLSNYENTNNKNYFTEILNENWNKKSENLFKEIDGKVASLNSSLINVVKEEVNEYSKSIQSQLDQQHLEITKNEEKIGQIEGWQAWFNERIETIKAQTNNLETNIKTVEENQTKIEDRLKNVAKQLEGVDGQLNYVFSEMSEMHLYIILFLVLVVIAGIFAVQKLVPLRQPSPTTDRRASPEAQGTSMRSGPRVGGKEQSHTAIYSTLSRRTRVRGISIISFHSATQTFHQKLMEAVSLPQTLPLQAYLIEKQEDLLKVNPYMITIIFVDFNERNIILENPEIEVGDHRRYTTEIFLQLGCDVFVIYCKDKDSQSLPRDQLYSTKLHSINQHATLAKLKKKNRVFSVCASLHPQQVKILEDCFKQL